MSQSAPSSGTPTAAPCSESAPPMDGSPACTCTREMPGCSIHPRGRDEWIACMRDSLAKTSAWLDEVRESTALPADYGQRWSEPFVTFDRPSRSWKTAQQSFLVDSVEFSETWPTWGMMRAGACCQHPPLVPATFGRGGGASAPIPTPTVCGNYNRKGASLTAGDGLAMWVEKWPTPRCSAGMTSRLRNMNGKVDGKRLEDSVAMVEGPGGKLNPTWVEWLMGWPLGHSGSKRSVTAKSRSRRRSPGDCSGAHDESHPTASHHPPPPASASGVT